MSEKDWVEEIDRLNAENVRLNVEEVESIKGLMSHIEMLQKLLETVKKERDQLKTEAKGFSFTVEQYKQITNRLTKERDSCKEKVKWWTNLYLVTRTECDELQSYKDQTNKARENK